MPDISFSFLGFTPLLLMAIAGLFCLRVLAKIGSAGSGKWTRFITTTVYVTVIWLMLVFVAPVLGWIGFFLVTLPLALFVIVNLWVLYPNLLQSKPDTSKLGKLDGKAWKSIGHKRWFVAGQDMLLIWWIRRALAVYLLVVISLFSAFVSGGSNGGSSSSSSGNSATVAETERRSSEPDSSPTPSATKTASPEPAKSSPSAVTTAKSTDPASCDAPEMPPVEDDPDGGKSSLNTADIEVCIEGDWKLWANVHPDAGSKLSVTFQDYNDEFSDTYGFGRIVYGTDKQTAVIRLKLADIVRS